MIDQLTSRCRGVNQAEKKPTHKPKCISGRLRICQENQTTANLTTSAFLSKSITSRLCGIELQMGHLGWS